MPMAAWCVVNIATAGRLAGITAIVTVWLAARFPAARFLRCRPFEHNSARPRGLLAGSFRIGRFLRSSGRGGGMTADADPRMSKK